MPVCHRPGWRCQVHYWVAAIVGRTTVSCSRVPQLPSFHSGGEAADASSETQLSIVHYLHGRSSPSSLSGTSRQTVQPGSGVLPATLPTNGVSAIVFWRHPQMKSATADVSAPCRDVETSGVRSEGGLWQSCGEGGPRRWWPYQTEPGRLLHVAGLVERCQQELVDGWPVLHASSQRLCVGCC